MSWNYRVMACDYNDEVYFQIHEVYYDENGNPDSYIENPVTVGGDNLSDIHWTLNRMKEATKKPILWTGEKFPNEVKIKYSVKNHRKP